MFVRFMISIAWRYLKSQVITLTFRRLDRNYNMFIIIYLTFVQAPREEYEGLVPDISDSVVSHILFSLYMIMRKDNACILNLWTINYSTWDKCALGGSLGHEIDPGLL